MTKNAYKIANLNKYFYYPLNRKKGLLIAMDTEPYWDFVDNTECAHGNDETYTLYSRCTNRGSCPRGKILGILDNFFTTYSII